MSRGGGLRLEGDVGRMAIRAFGARVVILRLDLLEACGAGDVCLMAQQAELDHIRGFLGLALGRIAGVDALGAVAGLAGELGVAAALLLLGHVGVALYAGLLPGVDRGPLADVIQGTLAVVAKLAEALGDEDGPGCHEKDKAEAEEGHDADEMSGVLEQAWHDLHLRWMAVPNS